MTQEQINNNAIEYGKKQGINYPLDASYRAMIQSQIISAFKDGAISILAATPPPQGLALYVKCDLCNGDGYTAEHDLSCNGNCEGTCPVQVQCAKCSATGFVEYESAAPQKDAKTFYCADWNRCGSICEEQCPACNKAENAPEIIPDSPQTDSVDGNDFTLWVIVNRWEYVTERHEWVNNYIGELKGVSVKYKGLVEIFKQNK